MVLHTAHDNGNGNGNEEVFLMDWIRKVALEKGERDFATWYDGKGKQVNAVTFGGLWEEAGVIAAYLRNEWQMEKGDRVVLCYTPGIQFFAALLGCFRAGVIAVLVYPPDPSSAEKLASSLKKMVKSIDDCHPKLVLCDASVHLMRTGDNLNVLFSRSRKLWPAVPFHVTENLRGKGGDKHCFDEPSLTPNDIAFFQYTSGSTGDPKGVIIKYGALAANIRLIHNGFRQCYREDGGVPEEIVGFSWLPQYHDLGLVYAGIAPFMAGMRMHMMSPLTFLSNPLLWVQLMSQLKVSWGVAPDFAYNLVTRRFNQALKASGGKNPLPGLDLSCIHNLQSGTEPVRPHTKINFENAFSPYGLRKDWFHAGYGLAENVVGVSWIHGYHLSTPRPDEDMGPLVAVGSRHTFDKSLDVRIVIPETMEEAEDNTTGELWIAGPSVAGGYHGKPELSKGVFEAKLSGSHREAPIDPSKRYLSTGDLAFIQNDNLYICGRIKDLLIVNGRNYYPSDIELAAQEASEAIRPGCVAAFSDDEINTDASSLTIVFEIRASSSKRDAASVIEGIRQSVINQIGLMPYRIVAIKERTILKTTSGKIRRRATLSALKEGSLSIVLDEQRMTTTRDPTAVSSKLGASRDERNEVAPCGEKYESIVSQIIGTKYSPDDSWGDNGLSSMQQVELVNELSEAFPVEIPSDFQTVFGTPLELKEHILGPQAGAFFPTKIDELAIDRPISKNAATAVQMFGVWLLLSLLSVSTIPVYYLVVFVTEQSNGAPWREVLFPFGGLLLPPIIVLWHFSFSVVVLLAKWLVIGKYSERKAFLPSIYYLRWWLLDRLLDLWEFFSGRFIKDTPLIWVFYRLMGVKMPYNVRIDAFLREFDLIQIDAHSSVLFGMRCRKFGSWEAIREHTSAPSLRFRPIHIEANCTIRGHVGLGSSVGQGSWVEKLASVPEGSLVPSGAVAVGSPAHQSFQEMRESTLPGAFVFLEMGKVAWILVQVCLASLFTTAGESVFTYVFEDTTKGWRYSSLFEIMIVFACSTMLGLLTCIPMKWILIGRRRPGQSDGCVDGLLRWIVDYQFNLYRTFFDLVALNSVAVNLYLKAMGMDIDMKSKVWPSLVPPSKVDLVTIHQSFVSAAVFDVSNPQSGTDSPQPIVLESSSISHSVVLAGGVTVRHSEVIPFSHVTNHIIGDSQKWRSEQHGLPSVLYRASMDLMAIVLVIFLTASFIPTLEFFNATAALDGRFQFPVVRIILSLCVHSSTWYFLFVALHRILFLNKKVPLSLPLYFAYMQLMEFFFELSLLSLFFGTPAMKPIFQGLGCHMKNRDDELWYFGKRVYDVPLLTFQGPTIVDTSLLSGHIVVLGKASFGECKVRGLLHEGTVCLAHTDIEGKRSKNNGEDAIRNEVGPMCFVAPTGVAPLCPTQDVRDTQHTQPFEESDDFVDA
ncbi:Putative fatty-acid--CoA ligase FadD21 [Seminavis robusta]|uniref:Fatty-acid--CoA ligase FadD21 n=1 Tax=Seminavis robusta TaxID=568900 RepID=A0A9N8HXD0_9STRA|nr:Putative fatty-acid--CoA ligase FadD21 [Seminavis robusta]|eukprot:Sro2181_g317980.1 Putative fatty-acid--CoA ligase FadD21 (1431) ;mRNA; f:755-5472